MLEWDRCAAKQADYMNPGCRFLYNDKGTWAAKIATTDSHYMWMCMHIAHIHTHKHISNGTIQKYLTNERAVSCSFSFYCCTLSFCFVLACHCLTMQCHTPYAIPYHAMPCLVLWCPFAKRALRFFFYLFSILLAFSRFLSLLSFFPCCYIPNKQKML